MAEMLSGHNQTQLQPTHLMAKKDFHVQICQYFVKICGKYQQKTLFVSKRDVEF